MSSKAIAKKQKAVDELKQKLDTANLMLLADYRGFTVKELTELRKKLRAHESEFRVVKNTLLQRAFEAAGFAEIKAHLQGTTALLLGYQDPVQPLKTLVTYLKEIEKGTVRAGIMEKGLIDSQEIQTLAKLPPKEVLLAKVVGGFQAPIYGLVNVLQGPLRKLVYALAAIKDKKGV